MKSIDRFMSVARVEADGDGVPPFRWWVAASWWACTGGTAVVAALADAAPVAAVVVGLAFAAVLWLRHHVPAAAFLIVIVLTIWSVDAGVSGRFGPQWTLMMLVPLSYLVGRCDGSRLPVTVQLGVASVVCLVGGPIAGLRVGDWVGLVAALTTLIIFPWLVGRYRSQSARLAASGWQRAEQLEREQRAVAAQARLRERARIAEDMHDSLGHELSLIALRAAALEVDPALAPSQQESVGELRRSAAAATERLREIIGVLREDGVSLSPADETIADVVGRARDSGMTIALSIDPSRILPRRADRAAHRVVQEALTNAAKHAPGSAVSVTVDHRDAECVVTVVNDVPTGTTSGIGGRTGLEGLAERVRLAGGRFAAGTDADRFVVEAVLPLDEDAPVAPEPLSESAQRHVTERRRTRQRLLTVFAIPTVLVILFGVVGLVALVVVMGNSTMSHAEYESIEVGATRDELASVLPRFEIIDPPSSADLPPELDGLEAECAHYATGSPIDGVNGVYRLCFVDDVLRSKDVVSPYEEF